MRWSIAIAYSFGLASLVLWPRHIRPWFELGSLTPAMETLAWLGVSNDERFLVIEVAANVLLFVPLGLALALRKGRMNWLTAMAVGLFASVVIELLQWLMPVDRTPSLRDVIANTSGSLLGASIGGLVIRADRSHPEKADG